LLGDHYTFRKTRPYQGSIHIPLIIAKAPGTRPGTVCDRIAELRDILPTMVELAGGQTPEGIDGVSLLHENHREYLHGEHSGGDLGNQYIVTKEDKFCWFMESGREQYFRLDQDPQELHDAIRDPEYQDRIAYLRNILIRELEGREECYTDGVRLIPGRKQKSCLSFLPAADI